MSTKLWVPYGTSTPFALVISPVQYRVHFIHSSKHTGRKRKSWINIKKPTQYPESLGTAVKYRARVFVPGRFLRGPQRACRYWLCHLLYKAFTIQRHFFGRIPNESSFGGCLFKLYLIRYSLGKLKCLHFQSIAASAIHSHLEPSGHQGAPLKRQDFIFKKRKMFHPLLDSERLALVFFISPSSWHRCVLNVLCRTLQQSFPYRNDTT